MPAEQGRLSVASQDEDRRIREARQSFAFGEWVEIEGFICCGHPSPDCCGRYQPFKRRVKRYG